MFKKRWLSLTKRLYPKGNAFKMPYDSSLEKMNKGLIISENEVLEKTLSILDSILPDNDNFTLEDAVDWERRLGLISNPLTSLFDKKLGIKRKMNHPGDIKARQHYLYLERELRNSGFNVRVHENRFLTDSNISEQLGVSEFGVSEYGGETDNPFKYEVKDPNSFSTGLSQYGFGEYGEAEYGGSINFSLVANHLDEDLDNTFFDSFLPDYRLVQYGTAEYGVSEMGGTFTYPQALRSSFFVSGDSETEMANILLNRKDEFRQMILRIKPVQSVGILLINYTNPTTGVDFNNDFNIDFNI